MKQFDFIVVGAEIVGLTCARELALRKLGRVLVLEKEAKVGIRPQLMDLKKKQLEMDCVIETGQNSIHVLNAISPAFTCAMAFAPFVVNKISA